MMDRGIVQNNVEFHAKIKFVRLVHLVGFIIKHLRCFWPSSSSGLPNKRSVRLHNVANHHLLWLENWNMTEHIPAEY